MEDIIALAIIAIIPVVVVYGAVLLRKRFVRRKQQKLKLRREQLERQQERIESIAKRSRERERQRIREIEAIAKTYGVGDGVVGRQECDLNTNTFRTSVRDPKTNTTHYVTTPAAQIAPGTVLPQAVNSGTDLFTGMAIGSLVNSLFSTPTYSRPSIDDSDSQKSAYKSSSSSDSSSSWSDSSSSDSSPSSDW
jgi:hypothetical protein